MYTQKMKAFIYYMESNLKLKIFVAEMYVGVEEEHYNLTIFKLSSGLTYKTLIILIFRFSKF